MKWSYRIVQSFSPGLDGKERALKAAPDVWARSVHRRANEPNPRFGRHFQGVSCDTASRAEALGYSVGPSHGHRMVTPVGRALVLHRLPQPDAGGSEAALQ
jgi:hypothetical protein